MSVKSTHRFRGVTRRRFLALGAATLLLGACGGSDSSTSSSDRVADTTVEVPAVVDTALDANAPVEAAGKIVSLSATATEMLYAIGAQDQIVAVDNYSNFPAEAAAFEPKIDAYEPSVEAIAALDPTTVLIAFDPGSLQSQLEKLGIAVWVGAPATNFDDAYRQIAELGELTGKATEASSLVESMKSDIESAVSTLELPDAPVNYFYELDDTFFSVTSNTFIGQVMSLFMMENIADTAESGNDYPQLSQEFIISANPKLILLADTKCCKQNAKTVEARPGWNKIDAVTNGNIVELDDDIASRWGPRVVDLVKQVAGAITSYMSKLK